MLGIDWTTCMFWNSPTVWPAPSVPSCWPIKAPERSKSNLPGAAMRRAMNRHFIGGVPHPERSSLFLAFNTNKRGITLEMTTPTGRDLLLRLLASQDIVIESFAPGYLESSGVGVSTCMRQVNPRLISCLSRPLGRPARIATTE